MWAMEMRLPKRRNIEASAGPDKDPLPYYYWPLIGSFYRKRLSLGLELMGSRKVRSLLEIGYGSGIFLPELSTRCERLVGVDVHDSGNLVRGFLRREDVTASLCSASVTDMPLGDESFDCVVCMSVLEHVLALDKAITEIKRVLKRGGFAIVGFPTRNTVSSLCIRLLGFDPVKQHPNDHYVLLNRFHNLFPPQRVSLYPSWLSSNYGLYVVLECVKHG